MASSKKIRMIPYRFYSSNSKNEYYQRGALGIKHFSGINDNALLLSSHDKSFNDDATRYQDVAFNFQERGTDRSDGSSSIADPENVSMSANTRNQLTVIGDVKNIFGSNKSAYGCTMTNNDNHRGMFLALGCDKKIDFKNSQYKNDYQTCGHHQTRATLIQDVIGVGFNFNYFGSHDGSKTVHPYIDRIFMVYGVNRDSTNDLNMYLFAREIKTDLWGQFNRDPGNNSGINSDVFSYGGIISGSDIGSMKNAGLMGNKNNASYGGNQRVAYWMGLAFKLNFPKKNTAKVTRTIHFHDVRPIVSDSTDMSSRKPNNWVIPCDPNANPDNNTHRYDRRHQFLYY